MKIKEIEECAECPLGQEDICPGGWVCYGGEPIEPPCCNWTDEELEMNIEEYMDKWYGREKLQEEHEKCILEEKREKERKNKIAAKKRQYIKSYCVVERLKVKSLRKKIRSLENIERFASSMAVSFNITNEMFRYPERKEVNPVVEDSLKALRDELKRAEQRLKEKQKECRKTEYYKNIGKEM